MDNINHPDNRKGRNKYHGGVINFARDVTMASTMGESTRDMGEIFPEEIALYSMGPKPRG